MAKDDKKPAPGTADMGRGMGHAATEGEGALKDGFRGHNEAHKVPVKKDKTYASELGATLAEHASEQGRKFN